MKILVISNLYPPYFLGGYEIGCSLFVEEMKRRGHDVIVLTSNYMIKEFKQENNIFRYLYWDDYLKLSDSFLGKFFNLLKREIQAYRAILAIKKVYPEKVYIWNPDRIPISILHYYHNKNIPISTYAFDYWLCQWANDPWIKYWYYSKNCGRKQNLLRIITKPVLQLFKLIPPNSLPVMSVFFCSEFLKNKTCAFSGQWYNSLVIPWGVSLSKYKIKDDFQIPPKTQINLLFAGRVAPEKGISIAIDILDILIKQKKINVKLTILGIIADEGYLKSILDKIKEKDLTDSFEFRNAVSHNKMPEVYKQYDALIFPSAWDEPFGMTILEAMASGLIVFISGKGGSKELVKHKQSGFIFDTPMECADYFVQVFEDAILYRFIRANAQAEIKSNFDLNRVFDLLEIHLKTSS